MNTQNVLIIILFGVIAVLIYNYARQPQPLQERMDNAISQLKQGEPGKAVDELNTETRGEQMKNDIKAAITPSPTY